jgi:uncharacterized membrane-anchored protein
VVPLKTVRRRDVLYWLAVSFTFALGTAAGDLTAGQLHFGFVGSIVRFASSWPCLLWAVGVLLQQRLGLLVGAHNYPTARRFRGGLNE